MDIFPEHFMFELTEEEFTNLRSQIVTSKWGGQRYLPFVFTELGVLQLANVLKSLRARFCWFLNTSNNSSNPDINNWQVLSVQVYT